MHGVDSGRQVLVAGSVRFAFVPRHFYCADTLLPANTFPLSSDERALLEGNQSME